MRPKRGLLAAHWALDPETTFLNHGSFGAVPNIILEEQSFLRSQIEMDPVKFYEREFKGLMYEARKSLSFFLNAAPNGMTFVRNATEGVNTILRSLCLLYTSPSPRDLSTSRMPSSA